MSDDLDAFATKHGLGAQARDELRQLMGKNAVFGASTLLTGTWADGEDDPAPSTEVRLDVGAGPGRIAGRYEDLGLIGTGGMGEVRRVRDVVLDRTVAMKIVRGDRAGLTHAIARFLEEAHATAQLQHPGIVPVHDVGQLDDGRPWFTMREVRGEPLEDVIRAVHRADGSPSTTGWTFRRVLAAFVAICNTVAYAHRRGVLHRDLKPGNLMLGDLGEVYVLDWGIAKILGRVLVEGDEPVVRGPAAALATRVGKISGTPGFMAPEQASETAAASDPAVDLYALGAVLYVALCGHEPYTGSSAEILEQLRMGPPVPVQERARGPVAAELAGICSRAMAREPRKRFPTADALGGAVQDWLVGARRREQALEVAARADARARRSADLERCARELRRESQGLLAGLDPWSTEEEKAPGWAAEDQARIAERAVRLEELAVDQTLQAALQIDPELPEAHVALVERHRARHASAEEAGDDDVCAAAETLLRAHAEALPGGHPVRRATAAYLKGDGALTLVTEPPGAEVLLYRVEEHNRRLVEVFERSLGQTPLIRESLPRGSYLCLVRHPDCDEVRYPVEISRLGHWDGERPGESEPHAIRLPTRGQLGPDVVYVPAGWFRFGGDPLVDCFPRGRSWCDALVVQRFPVTNAQLVAFLNHLILEGDEALALAIVPRETVATGDTDAHPRIARNERGLYDLSLSCRGVRWPPDWPAVLIDWDGARACLQWLAEQSGHPWRLPSELEWEKAARGVDGRWFPWGNHHDWSWANNRLSSPGPPGLVSISDHPVDCSIYGVRGLGGSSLDWCMDAFVHPPPSVPDLLPEPEPVAADLRVVRGGSCKGRPRNARVAYRYRNETWRRHADLGVRGFCRPW